MTRFDVDHNQMMRDDRIRWLRRMGGDPLAQKGTSSSGWSPTARLQGARPNLEKYPDVFTVREEDGVIGIKVRCRSCKTPSVLWNEHEDVEIGHGATAATVPAARWETVPVAALKHLAAWCCELCTTKEEAATSRALSEAEGRKRLVASRMPMAIAEAVSWESMLVKGDNDQETQRRERAIEVCREWSTHAKPKHAILLHGPPGSGKTRLAATAAVSRLAHSPILWVSVAVLMAELDAAWSDAAREEALRVLTRPGPLVLDDIDNGVVSVRHKQFLYTAIDKREQAGEHAVIITGNGQPSELEKKLGDVLMSRIAGMCHSGAGMLPFPGPDRRLELGEGG